MGINAINDVGIDSNAQILDAKDIFNEVNSTVTQLKIQEQQELNDTTYAEVAADVSFFLYPN